MDNWAIKAHEMILAHGTVVLVTVAEARGSAPRGVGTKMLVSTDRLMGTIGGGALEYQAIDQAHKLLTQGDMGHRFQPYALGPLLEQCCGGSVTLLLETLDSQALPFLMELASATSGHIRTDLAGERSVKQWMAAPIAGLALLDDRRVGASYDKAVMMLEPVAPEKTPLYMFGAGHVGRAVAYALAPLPFEITWIDSRPHEFPKNVGPDVHQRLSNAPADLVIEAPPACVYLVFTHSHQLDYEITRAILKRGDARFCGLIGSATKRARFESRFRKEGGLSADQIIQLTCPIGIDALRGKEPEVIAASVTAQLLQLTTKE